MKIKFLSVLNNSCRKFLRYFGICQPNYTPSPLLTFQGEKTGGRAKLFEKIRDESDFSLEMMLNTSSTPTELEGLTPEETVTAIQEQLVYLRERKEEQKIDQTQIFRRRLLLIAGLGAVALIISAIPKKPKKRYYNRDGSRRRRSSRSSSRSSCRGGAC